jgi:hypothetical protein
MGKTTFGSGNVQFSINILQNISYIIFSKIKYFCQYIFVPLFTKILAPMSHNVPAVCDVPARPIKQTVGLRAGWNVPE